MDGDPGDCQPGSAFHQELPFLSPLLEKKSGEAQHKHWPPVGSDRVSPWTKDLEGLRSLSTQSTPGDALPATPGTDPSLNI